MFAVALMNTLRLRAASVLDDCGLTISAAIRLFWSRWFKHKAFLLKLRGRNRPRGMVKALEEAKLIEQQFSSLDEMMQELSSGESRGKQQASKMS